MKKGSEKFLDFIIEENLENEFKFEAIDKDGKIYYTWNNFEVRANYIPGKRYKSEMKLIDLMHASNWHIEAKVFKAIMNFFDNLEMEKGEGP